MEKIKYVISKEEKSFSINKGTYGLPFSILSLKTSDLRKCRFISLNSNNINSIDKRNFLASFFLENGVEIKNSTCISKFYSLLSDLSEGSILFYDTKEVFSNLNRVGYIFKPYKEKDLKISVNLVTSSDKKYIKDASAVFKLLVIFETKYGNEEFVIDSFDEFLYFYKNFDKFLNKALFENFKDNRFDKVSILDDKCLKVLSNDGTKSLINIWENVDITYKYAKDDGSFEATTFENASIINISKKDEKIRISWCEEIGEFNFSLNEEDVLYISPKSTKRNPCKDAEKYAFDICEHIIKDSPYMENIFKTHSLNYLALKIMPYIMSKFNLIEGQNNFDYYKNIASFIKEEVLK